jgi:hypothetical protein
MDTFSSFCDLNVGFLLCLGMRFPDKTSIREINFSPSDNSVSKLEICGKKFRQELEEKTEIM